MMAGGVGRRMPYSYLLVKIESDFAAISCANGKIDYGGENDAGAIDGADGQAVFVAAINKINADGGGTLFNTTSLTLTEKVVLKEGVRYDSITNASLKPATSFDMLELERYSSIGYIEFDVSGIQFEHACILLRGYHRYSVTNYNTKGAPNIDEIYALAADHSGSIYGAVIKLYCTTAGGEGTHSIGFVQVHSLKAKFFKYIIWNKQDNVSGNAWTNANTFDGLDVDYCEYLYYEDFSGDGTHNAYANKFRGNYQARNGYAPTGTEYVCKFVDTRGRNIIEVNFWDMTAASSKALDVPNFVENVIITQTDVSELGNLGNALILSTNEGIITAHGYSYKSIDSSGNVRHIIHITTNDNIVIGYDIPDAGGTQVEIGPDGKILNLILKQSALAEEGTALKPSNKIYLTGDRYPSGGPRAKIDTFIGAEPRDAEKDEQCLVLTKVELTDSAGAVSKYLIIKANGVTYAIPAHALS